MQLAHSGFPPDQRNLSGIDRFQSVRACTTTSTGLPCQATASTISPGLIPPRRSNGSIAATASAAIAWRATIRYRLCPSTSYLARTIRDRHRLRRIHRQAGHGLRRHHPAVLPHLTRRRQQDEPRLRSGHRGGPRRRSGDAPVDHHDIPATWHRRRGIRRRAPERRICLGARPDRRHQVLHLRGAALGHVDCSACTMVCRPSA